MEEEVLNLLLSGEVSFHKPKESDLQYGKIRGYMNPPIKDVFGDSEREILEKIIHLKKLNKKKEKSYFKLPELKDVKDRVRNGEKLKSKYKIRLQDDPNYWQFDFNTKEVTKEAILLGIFIDDYFDWGKFIEGGYELIRNSREIDWTFWSKHKNVIKDYLKEELL